METGALSEDIVVTGAAPLVETSNASTGGVLDKAALDTLPSQNRNAFLMSVAIPTVVASGDASYNRMQDQSGASAVSLGGGAVRRTITCWTVFRSRRSTTGQRCFRGSSRCRR